MRLGKSPWNEAIHLAWSVWVFITPMFSTGYTLRWLWLTLLSYPLFLLLFAVSFLYNGTATSLVSSSRGMPILIAPPPAQHSSRP